MTHDFDGFPDELQRFPRHPARARPLDGIDPSFVFDFQAYDDLGRPSAGPRGSRSSPHRAPSPARTGWSPRRARSTPTSASSRPARRPTSSSRARGARPESVVMAAKRYRGEDHRTSTERRLHRRPPQSAPATTGHGPQDRLRPRGRGRPVGRAEWGAGAALGAGPPGPLPGPDRRHRDPHGVGHRRRRDRPAAGPDPAGPTCWSRTSSSSATRWPSWPARARARRPVAVQPPGRGRTAGDHRPAADGGPGGQPAGMDFLLRDCTNVCRWFRRRARGGRARPLRGALAHAF